MIAFIKRRWILLSCMGVLLACSIFSVEWRADDAPSSVGTTQTGGVGIGRLYYSRHNFLNDGEPFAPEIQSRHAFHFPDFGTYPIFERETVSGLSRFYLQIPLWLPLSIVVAWIVIRELRWREHRARVAEQSLNAQPTTLN